MLRRVLLLDSDLAAKMVPITTRDFLSGLEDAHRINSADEVYRRAEEAGRLASKRMILDQQHEAARAPVARLVRPSLRKRKT